MHVGAKRPGKHTDCKKGEINMDFLKMITLPTILAGFFTWVAINGFTEIAMGQMHGFELLINTCSSIIFIGIAVVIVMGTLNMVSDTMFDN